MLRSTSLKPAFREARKLAGLSPWAVNVPAHLAPTAKRQELFFATKTDAQTECDKLAARKDNFGTSLRLLSSAQITEASKCIELLKPSGLGLLEVVREYLRIREKRVASITFFELCNRYLAAKSGRDVRHLRGLRNTRDRTRKHSP